MAPSPSPLPPAPGPPSLSYSALEAYRRCGYRFYVQRVLGLPDEAPPGGEPAAGGDARRRGLLAHAALEELDFERPRVLDGPELARLADSRGLAMDESELAQVAALVEAFAASPLCARLARARVVHREHPFALALSGGAGDGPLLTGAIDALAHEHDGGALVVDYKTDRVSGDPDAGERDLYSVQRAVYALAVLRAGAPAVEVAHCFLEAPGVPASRRYSAGEADRLEHEIYALAGAIQRGRFPVAEHPHRELCLTCPARRRLCSWDEELTLRVAGAEQTR
jgi:RecB family exonuclease